MSAPMPRGVPLGTAWNPSHTGLWVQVVAHDPDGRVLPGTAEWLPIVGYDLVGAPALLLCGNVYSGARLPGRRSMTEYVTGAADPNGHAGGTDYDEDGAA